MWRESAEVVSLLEFYVQATSKMILGQVPICDSVPSWQRFSAAHWETRPPAPWPDIPLSHNILTLIQTDDLLNRPSS